MKGAANEDVAFQGNNAHLTLDDGNKFHGTILDFVNTDDIDLKKIDFATAGFSFSAGSDILSVSDGVHSANIQFEDGYTAGEFSLADDGHGHTLVLTSITTPHAAAAEPFVEL